ncbi:MAG: adenylate kinase [Gemmatimonadetes bacterium]|nr:adenylate kinase [Gemmatimonadota bacterium]MBT5058458.1 adenylate kinase [Gemmatimonadota bacterium]MBT5141284.1 adenylate kinase [Gemmatimonadota bacterium]MBT5590365.1 adenylate kinase [Gemmatimonadota bacterium]MBT5963898.1 adenylate kinase [Gemmatimonadota bacterium]
MTNASPSLIGQRIAVIGNTGSGKSTLAEQLAELLGVPFVELDAINWQPNWVGLHDTNPEEFKRQIAAATAGDGWVTAGSYASFSQEVFWPRLETAIWLDPPLALIVWRVLSRSWRRWRTKELLWGTNYESFWQHLALWRRADSLLWWALTQHRVKRAKYLSMMDDPQWGHVRFVRLTSVDEVDALVASIRTETQSRQVADSSG